MYNQVQDARAQLVEKPSQIPDAFNALAIEIEDLDTEVNTLLERLSPVMRSEPSCPKPTDPTSPPSVPMVNTIKAFQARIRSIRDRVAESRGCLEL